MGNLFDSLRDSTFDVTLATFGYDASWTTSADDEITHTARVHFKDPNGESKLSGVEYAPLSPFMEYRFPSMPGLYESVRLGNGEAVTIDGTNYNVVSVERMVDGKTYKAYLELAE